jgi:regulator of replication initiation timing
MQLRWLAKSGCFVQDLVQVECDSLEDALLVYAEGMRNRKVASHQLNRDSSRSHCLMTLNLKSVDGEAGRLSLVDLAGSERLAESGSEGQHAKETSHINRSLFALGNVISALADPRKRTGHIPYRDSKLTRLLENSLGGNGRTLMVACISPSDKHLDETCNTLHFASRAKNIASFATVQVDSSAAMVESLKLSVRRLREENDSLHERLEQRPQLSLSASPKRRSSPRSTAGGDAPESPGAADELALADELSEAREENESLRAENGQLRTAFASVQRENQILQQKIERLEHIFDEESALAGS